MRFAKRLDQVPPYLFAELERKIEEREKAGIDVISLGIGDPDLPTPEPVIEALARAARNPSTHQYPSNRGTDEFRAAVAEFYEDRFGVDLDSETEVIPVLGGKEGVAHIALATLDPGDTALAPDPGYPPYTSGPVFSGANVHYLPLAAENGFLPDLGSAPDGAAALPQLPEQPDRSDGRGRVLHASRRLGTRARDDRRPRQRVLGDHVRRLPGTELPRGARREGRRRRDLLALEGLEHDRLARGLDRRQPRSWSSATGT